MSRAAIDAFHDPATGTLTYVVSDPGTKDAVVIDPVLDYDAATSATSTGSVERVMAFLSERGLHVRLLMETHAHADHLSGSAWLQAQLVVPVAIGARIVEVQRAFAPKLGLPDSFPTDGRQFDRLLRDGETVQAGSLLFEVIATPGHTPACLTYRIGDDVFTGDALFLEDLGTGRCDFPGGSAADLYTSVHERLYRLPDETRVHPGHDYPPASRGAKWETTIAAERERNVSLRGDMAREEFVQAREKRDATLQQPKLLMQAIRANVNAGRVQGS